jgi:pimeloyl-ACP methyl ester carboxylesterase
MGGFVGLIYALQFPDTLSALILDSTAPSHHYKDDPSSIYPTLRDSDAFRNLPRVEDHLFPCIDLEYGEDVGVKPIVPLVRFVAEPCGAVNFNAFHDASYRQG